MLHRAVQVATMVEEYFASGDIGEVAISLEDLGAPDFMHYFIKRVIVLALDRKDREREMTSVLLSSLYAEVCGEHVMWCKMRGRGWASACVCVPPSSLQGVVCATCACMGHAYTCCQAYCFIFVEYSTLLTVHVHACGYGRLTAGASGHKPPGTSLLTSVRCITRA